ncbi:LysE family translocator, partial [Pseudomonas aeruginosa]|nr:LysE family translocator [Pseudomonas aeruginosa]
QRLATSLRVVAGRAGRGKPLSYWGAAAFQWVNPKAWVMAVGAISTYTPLQGYFTNVVVISTVFALINAPTIGIWAGFGSMLRNVLRDPRWLRVFNVGMALLLVASLYPILAESHSA